VILTLQRLFGHELVTRIPALHYESILTLQS
jgi:hypothetical protein